MKRAFTILFVLAALTGCYQLGEIRPTTMRSIHTLAIPSFRNGTLIPRVEVLFADIATRAFQTDGTYEIVDEGKADAILVCKLSRIDRTAILSLTTNVLSTNKFQLRVTVDYQVINRITGAVLQQGTANGATTYFVSDDLVSEERNVLPLAAQNMATSLVTQLTQGW